MRQSDIYAMGMTANKMLMGQAAGWYWKEERVSGNGNGQKIDENKAMLIQILSQMVSLDKTDRYETAAMVLEDLDFLLFFDLFRISRRIFRLAAGQRWFQYVIGLIFLLAAPLLEGKVL